MGYPPFEPVGYSDSAKKMSKSQRKELIEQVKKTVGSKLVLFKNKIVHIYNVAAEEQLNVSKKVYAIEGIRGKGFTLILHTPGETSRLYSDVVAKIKSEEFSKRLHSIPGFQKPKRPKKSPPGYHLKEISKGKLGELSKIREELDELEDAEAQGIKLLCLCELADIIGAIEAYMETHKLGMTLQDLIKMSDVTKRAFKNGKR